MPPRKAKPLNTDMTEAQEERCIMDAWRSLGGVVQKLSQPQAVMASVGTPDLRLQFPLIGRAMWWETKAKGGRLTVTQYQFLDREWLSGQTVGCGTYEEFVHAVVVPMTTGVANRREVGVDYVRAAQREVWDNVVRQHSHALLLQYGAKGFRRKQETLLQMQERVSLQAEVMRALGERLNVPG